MDKWNIFVLQKAKNSGNGIVIPRIVASFRANLHRAFSIEISTSAPKDLCHETLETTDLVELKTDLTYSHSADLHFP